MKHYTISYAQNREDVILDAFLGGVSGGFYVDVGANHPEHDSVTKLFYEKGWRGINIEPNKRLAGLLVAERPYDTNLNIGVSDKPGKLKFREYQGVGDGLSTFSDEMKDEYATTESDMTPHTRDYHDVTVPVKTLEQVFDDQKVKTINFLKVDVEGYEYEVLKGNDWDKYRPQMICIEANHVNHDWHPLLEEAGYKKVFFDGLNEYFLAKERPDIEEKFSYVKGLIGRPIIPLDVSEEIFRQESLNKKLEADRLQLNRRIAEYEKQIYHLSLALESQQRIKQQISRLARSIDAAILRRIEKLNTPSSNATGRKQIKPPLSSKSATQQDLLAIAQANDLDNFYAIKAKRSLNLRHFVYEVIAGCYGVFRIVGKTCARTVLKILRKTRRLRGA